MRFSTEWKQQLPCLPRRPHCLSKQSPVRLMSHPIPTYQWFSSQYIRLLTVASDVCLPACMDRPPDTDTHILSLAIGTRTRRSDHHPGLHSCLFVCNHRNEEDGLSLRIDSLSICCAGRVSSCPLCACLIVTQIVRIHRPSRFNLVPTQEGFPCHEPCVAGWTELGLMGFVILISLHMGMWHW